MLYFYTNLIILNIEIVFIFIVFIFLFIYLWRGDKFFTGHWRGDNKQVPVIKHEKIYKFDFVNN